jgi:hypothetical protein
VLAHFPGAQIIAVRGKDAGVASSPLIEAEDDYADGVDPDDDD